jgi:hypothetical protein
VWTTDKPKKEGIYWYREFLKSHSEPMVVLVKKMAVPMFPHREAVDLMTSSFFAQTPVGFQHIETMPGWWFGPLAAPPAKCSQDKA